MAVERVSGALNGRRGTFLLHHRGLMTRGTPDLSISVVPDSGTGELTGLTGTMEIVIAPGGKHSYDFEYALPARIAPHDAGDDVGPNSFGDCSRRR